MNFIENASLPKRLVCAFGTILGAIGIILQIPGEIICYAADWLINLSGVFKEDE